MTSQGNFNDYGKQRIVHTLENQIKSNKRNKLKKHLKQVHSVLYDFSKPQLAATIIDHRSYQNYFSFINRTTANDNRTIELF